MPGRIRSDRSERARLGLVGPDHPVEGGELALRAVERGAGPGERRGPLHASCAFALDQGDRVLGTLELPGNSVGLGLEFLHVRLDPGQPLRLGNVDLAPRRDHGPDQVLLDVPAGVAGPLEAEGAAEDVEPLLAPEQEDLLHLLLRRVHGVAVDARGRLRVGPFVEPEQVEHPGLQLGGRVLGLLPVGLDPALDLPNVPLPGAAHEGPVDRGTRSRRPRT